MNLNPSTPARDEDKQERDMMNDSPPFSLPESANETARHHHHHYETDKEAQSHQTEQPGTKTLDSNMIHNGENLSDTIDNDNHYNDDKAKSAARGFDLSQPANQAVVALCLVAVIAAIVVALLYATGLLSDELVPTPQPSLGPSMRPSLRPSAQPFASVEWFRVGSDIAGENRYDRSGSALAMSSNGTVLAIGSPQNDQNRPGLLYTGHVRIFDFSEQGWVQRGADLDGDAAGDYFGSSVSMSRDGSVVAVGAGGHDGVGGRDSGRVRVFVWDGSSWLARGSPLDGEAAGRFFGGEVGGSIPRQSVSLSDDGAVVAVGAPGRSDILGRLRIFDWNGVDWIQRGSALLGVRSGDRFGYAVSVSSDGSIVACGAFDRSRVSVDPSYVRVFRWTGTMWTQLGTDIQGRTRHDQFGRSLSISGDGMVVAVGAPGVVSGGNYCRVFEFDGNDWVQLGQTLEGGIDILWVGASVSMSRSGDRLVVGSPGTRGPFGWEAGHARVFRLTSNRRWLQQGNFFGPPYVGAQFGHAVAISDDEPSRVAIGVPDGADAGWVRVYQVV